LRSEIVDLKSEYRIRLIDLLSVARLSNHFGECFTRFGSDTFYLE